MDWTPQAMPGKTAPLRRQITRWSPGGAEADSPGQRPGNSPTPIPSPERAPEPEPRAPPWVSVGSRVVRRISQGWRPGFLLVHGWCVAFPRAGALGFCWFTGGASHFPGHRPGFLLVHGWCVAFPRAGALGFCWFTGGASHFPGHRPGLSACAPPGLHPDRIRPQPHHTGIGVPAVLHKPWRGPGGDHDRRCTGRSRPAPRGAVPCTGC
jgi:hypothetical protein